jgi:hypothetical protein
LERSCGLSGLMTLFHESRHIRSPHSVVLCNFELVIQNWVLDSSLRCTRKGPRYKAWINDSPSSCGHIRRDIANSKLRSFLSVPQILKLVLSLWATRAALSAPLTSVSSLTCLWDSTVGLPSIDNFDVTVKVAWWCPSSFRANASRVP